MDMYLYGRHLNGRGRYENDPLLRSHTTDQTIEHQVSQALAAGFASTRPFPMRASRA